MGTARVCDGLAGDEERVARVEELPVAQQVGEVGAVRHVPVDLGVLSAEDVHAGPGDVEGLTGLHGLRTEVAELAGRTHVREQARRLQGPQAVHVDVVRVLVGDQDGVEVAHVCERRHRAGVDEDPRVGRSRRSTQAWPRWVTFTRRTSG